MFQSSHSEHQDIGDITQHDENIGSGDGVSLKTQRRNVLMQFRNALCTRQVKRIAREFFPPWNLKEVMRQDLQESWRDAYVKI